MIQDSILDYKIYFENTGASENLFCLLELMGCVYLKSCPMVPDSKDKQKDTGISTVSLIIRVVTAFLYVKDHEKWEALC